MDKYPYYLNNEPVFANEDLKVTDKYTGEVAAVCALADYDAIDKGIAGAVEATEAMAKMPSFEKQKVLADELQKRLWEVIPFVPLAQYTQPVPHRKNVTGLLLAPIQVFWNMDKS